MLIKRNGPRGCRPWKWCAKPKLAYEPWLKNPMHLVLARGCRCETGVRKQFHWAWNDQSPTTNKSNTRGVDWPSQPDLKAEYACSSRQPQLTSPELHHGPPRQKSLSAAVATRNGKWTYLRPRLIFLVMNLTSKSPNFGPKSITKTKSSRTLKVQTLITRPWLWFEAPDVRA